MIQITRNIAAKVVYTMYVIQSDNGLWYLTTTVFSDVDSPRFETRKDAELVASYANAKGVSGRYDDLADVANKLGIYIVGS